MKAPLILTALLAGGLLFSYCKKKEKKEPEPTPTPTPTPTPFTKGFKKQDQAGNSFISDSAYCKPGASIYQLRSYRGKVAGDAASDIQISFKHLPLKQKTYPLDSIDIQNSRFAFSYYDDTYTPTAGQLVVSALTGSVASGSFQFTVVPSSPYVTSTLTVLSATFINIPVRN